MQISKNSDDRRAGLFGLDYWLARQVDCVSWTREDALDIMTVCSFGLMLPSLRPTLRRPYAFREPFHVKIRQSLRSQVLNQPQSTLPYLVDGRVPAEPDVRTATAGTPGERPDYFGLYPSATLSLPLVPHHNKPEREFLLQQSGNLCLHPLVFIHVPEVPHRLSVLLVVKSMPHTLR